VAPGASQSAPSFRAVAGQADVVLPVDKDRAVLARVIAKHAGDDEADRFAVQGKLDAAPGAKAVEIDDRFADPGIRFARGRHRRPRQPRGRPCGLLGLGVLRFLCRHAGAVRGQHHLVRIVVTDTGIPAPGTGQRGEPLTGGRGEMSVGDGNNP